MKTALVTGGTKGIGLAIVKILLDNDYSIIASYASDEENAQNVREELEKVYPGCIHIFKQSMEKEEDILCFIEECEQADLFKKGLDAVVLNAGCTDRTRWKELSWNQWMHVMDVNINAPACLLRSVDRFINENAAIVFISSDMSIYPHATSVPYTVSKAAVNGLTTALVKEYEDRKIRVNAILPGFVETPWQKNKPEDQKKRICEKVALHRFAEPFEISEIVFDVIKSTYINGSLIKVDGGYCYR